MNDRFANVGGGKAAGGFAVLVGFHLVADLLLITQPWFLEGDRLLLAISLPLSQCSLAVIWAVYSDLHLSLRFAVPTVTLVACWKVLATLLPWGVGEPASAACMVLLGVQGLTLLLACYLNRQFFAPESDHRGDGRSEHSRWTFQLNTLMLWTTVIGLALGFVQYGRVHWGWTPEGSIGEFSRVMSLVGLFNATLAALWLWALAKEGMRRLGSVLAIALVIVCLAYVLSRLVGWLSTFLELNFHDTLVLAAAQSLWTAVSMLVARTAFDRERPPATLDTGNV